jgi:hypothetical protein
MPSFFVVAGATVVALGVVAPLGVVVAPAVVATGVPLGAIGVVGGLALPGAQAAPVRMTRIPTTDFGLMDTSLSGSVSVPRRNTGTFRSA